MTKKLSFIIFCFCLLFIHTAHSEILQFENQIVGHVNVIVHTGSSTTTDSNAVLARMKTKADAFFSQMEFDEDLKNLAKDYDRIEPSIETQDNQVYITINMWTKPTIRSIKWKGNQRVAIPALQKELNISCFTPFDRQAFNTAFHKLKAYYIQQGFFEAKLDYHFDIDEENNEVVIYIDVEEGRAGKIQEIQFVNFEDDERYEVLQQMITKKYNLFTSWYTGTGIYNEEAMQQDELIITNFLQNEGFADAQVTISVQESISSDRILVIITADKGERYYIGNISFEGNELLSNQLIDSLFTVRPGEPYSVEDVRETLDIITEAYGRIGYIDAVIDFEPQLVEGEHKYNIRFMIEEGQQYNVGLIRVFGNISTQTPVILHETLLVPGEIFNSVKLKKTEQRLRNIGYFKNVNVYIVKGTESSLSGNYRDVYIEVEEMNTGQFSISAGYSSVEELFANVSVTERNFNYKGLGRVFRDGLGALRGGGEYATISAQVGQKSQSYNLGWTKPYFMDTKWTVGADLFSSITRYISSDYDLQTFGMNLRAQYNLNQFTRFGVHYRLKNGFVDLHLGDKHSSSESQSEQKGIHELREEAHIHGLISAVGFSLSYDSTNHPVKPSKGFRSKFMVEYAGVGGDHEFLSVAYLNSYYLPIGSRSVLKYRGDIRFIQPLGHTRYETMPLDERIFLGGDYIVRGYRPYRLGPQYPGTHIPRGGLSMQLVSFELSRRIIEDIQAFTFFDAGHLSSGTWEFGRLSVAVGYGFRFKLIPSIPEIALGMGYPLNPQNRSEVKKFFISIGGNF